MVDYKELWDKLKSLVNNWYEETDDEKEIKEKKLYSDLLMLLECLEEEQDGSSKS